MPCNRHGSASKGRYVGGITGREYKNLDDLNPGRIDETWPEVDGCKESLPPVYEQTRSEMPKK